MPRTDERFMIAALKLAKHGIGSVEPNPAVGCILVKNGTIIGKGWHKIFGGPHAEINALDDCKKQDNDPRGASMYVTLEPCCHQGKTGPCTDVIIKNGITEVIAATIDPSAHTAGRGLEQLKKAGISVRTGICEEQAKILNAPFMKFASTGKTWVIAKWAQSIDAKTTWLDPAGNPKWISNEKSRRDVHKLRRCVQAILVGINTVLSDDPLLTARPDKGRFPARIVLDTNLKIPLKCKLLKTAKKAPLIIATSSGAVAANLEKAAAIKQTGAEILSLPTMEGKCSLPHLVEELSKRNFQQILVEGGPTVIFSFLKQNLIDQVCVYIAPKILGSAGTSDISHALAQFDLPDLTNIDIETFDKDVKINGFIKRINNEKD